MADRHRPDEEDPFATNAQIRRGMAERRRRRIESELERNRTGSYRVPTWVMVVAILVIIGAWLALVFL